jgi:hypothetical protein
MYGNNNPAVPPQPPQPPPLGAPYPPGPPSPNGPTFPPPIYQLRPVTNHPNQRNEVLNKVYNNLTTRSNTFAVYCTVGYFEVVGYNTYVIGGQNVKRPILGKELSAYIPGYQRHRYFSVVDRTNLALQGTATAAQQRTAGGPPIFFPSNVGVTNVDPGQTNNPPPPTPAKYDQRVLVSGSDYALAVTMRTPATGFTPPLVGQTPQALTGEYDGTPWALTVGQTLYIDGGDALPTQWNPPGDPNQPTMSQQEAVTVTAISWVPIDPANPALGNMGLMQVRGTKVNPQYQPANPTAFPRFVFNHQHPIGFSVSQVILGNPGPQANFDYRTPPYTSVVPYAERIR